MNFGNGRINVQVGCFETSKPLTKQQRQMVSMAIEYRTPAAFHTLCMVWHMRISRAIPLWSVLEVYDYLVEHGYYDEEE